MKARSSHVCSTHAHTAQCRMYSLYPVFHIESPLPVQAELTVNENIISAATICRMLINHILTENKISVLKIVLLVLSKT